MADINITWSKKIKTIQKEFSKAYPYIFLSFFSAEEHEKSKKGEQMSPLDGNLTIKDVQTKKPKDDKGFSIHFLNQAGYFCPNRQIGLFQNFCS